MPSRPDVVGREGPRTRGWKRLEIEEHSHAAMANAYTAGASGLPCASFKGYLGSDLVRHNPNIHSLRMPLHRRDPVRDSGHPSGCDRDPRPTGGPPRQRPHRGHHRDPEGGGSGRRPGHRHCGRASRGPRSPQPQQRCVARLDDRRGSGGGGRRTTLLHPWLLPTGQRLLPGVGRPVSRDRDRFMGWLEEHVMSHE